jgi:CelD/BcsL family acetyltransferase involved in cellulose biosynthesis
MAPRIDWVDGPAAFAELAPRWDALATADAAGAFHTHCWFAAWWRAFGPNTGERLRVCVAHEGDELLAGLPLMRDGRGLRALGNVESPLLRPLHRDAAARDALLRAVLDEAGGELVLPLIPIDEPVGHAATAAARTARRLVYAEPPTRSPVVPLDGTWEDYRAQMKSKWGSIERKGRKMRRDHEAEVTMVEAPTDLPAQLARGFELERSGWKGRGGTAILDRPASSRFYQEVAEHFAATGELRLSEIVLDGELVAFDLAVLSGGRLWSLKTAYSEQHATLSPGLVLRRELIERCFELGLDAHELLGTDLAWKHRFATEFRPLVTWHALRARPAAAARVAYHRAIRPRLRAAYHRWANR